MKKTVITILVTLMLAAFMFGCAGLNKESNVVCPKCGDVFNTTEKIQNVKP